MEVRYISSDIFVVRQIDIFYQLGYIMPNDEVRLPSQALLAVTHQR